jgi:serine O-acetyltransferase
MALPKPPLAELAADFERHGRSPTNLGFWLLALYRYGRWVRSLPAPASRVGSLVYGAFLTAEEFVLASMVDRSTRIGKDPTFVEGRGIRIAPGAVIGDRVRIMPGVTIGYSSRPGNPSIGDDVVIGENARVLGPVKVGDRARIEPNSLVISDVPEGATVAGVPARVVRVVPKPESEP